MNAEPGLERSLRKASHVPRIGRTFQAVEQNQLPFRTSLRLMLKRHNRDPVGYPVRPPNGRKPLVVQATTPEVSRNREEMWISEERLKVRVQIRLYRNVATRGSFRALR